MNRERELPVDIAKGIGIVLVVLGHTVACWGGELEYLHRFIYSFHMPLFLGISGMHKSTRSSLVSFTVSKLERFIIPFLFWGMSYWVMSILVHCSKNLNLTIMHVDQALRTFDLSFMNKLAMVPLFANWSSLNSAGIDVDLWFLPAVFSIVVLSRCPIPLKVTV
jgi:fucose 4-O-acetylase-like acetyltransferase